MAIKLRVEDIGEGDMHLLGVNENNGMKVDYGAMPVRRVKPTPMEGKKRWYRKNLMTGQQSADEEYQKKNRIA